MWSSASPLDPLMAVSFAALGMAFVWGVYLQVRAIVYQRKNFMGFVVKLGAVGLLIAALAHVRENAVPYLAIFFVVAFAALGGAALARRTLVR